MRSQKLPKSEVLEKACDDGETQFFLGKEGDTVYEVCSWRPGPPNSGPPTQVHLLMNLGPGAKAVIRMKSARALDELVGLLLEYRNSVWPEVDLKS
jgi:hypothetical protein